MTENSGSTRDSLVTRIKNILVRPREEWPRIAGESCSIRDIFVGYVMPLAAIGPVCSFLGGQIFGYGAFGVHFRPSLTISLTTAILGYVLALIGVFVVMAVVDALAPRFGGVSNRLNAFKLVAYAMTAGALAGVFAILPAVAWLGILGLYSFYLFYTGVAPLMHVPESKALGFTLVTVLVTAVLYLVVSAIIGSIMAMMMPPPGLSDEGITGSVTVPGVGTVDIGKMQEAARQAEAQLDNGTVKAVDAAALQALLPETIGGFERTAIESAGLGAAGSNAEAEYSRGDQRFHLSVTDMSALGAMASMGAAMGVSANREDADGYERTRTVDGRIVREQWDRSAKAGEYSTTLANRFLVRAQGNVDDIDVLKDAVATLDEDRLTALAR